MGRHGSCTCTRTGSSSGIYLNPGISAALLKQNPQIAGTSAHIADITDSTQAGSTRRNSFRIDFSKPAATAYIRSQVKQFDAWGVDFIKMDFVGPGGGNLPADNREEMRQWHAALAQASHPIWLELSNFMSFDQAPLWRATSNGWRIENDIECYGPCDKSTDPAIHGNLTVWSKVVARFADVALDVLCWSRFCGGRCGGMISIRLNSATETATELRPPSASPCSRCGLSPARRCTSVPISAKMDAADLPLITNRELIAIDQAGVPARPARHPAPAQQAAAGVAHHLP